MRYVTKASERIVRSALAALLLAALGAWIMRRPLFGRERVAVLTGDGGLHVAGFERPWLRPAQSYRLLRITTIRQARYPLEYWQLQKLALSPDARLLALNEIEPVSAGEIDHWLALYNAANGALLFNQSDNFVPQGSYRGDDPAAPAMLQQLQADRDMRWETEKVEIGPDVARTILAGRLSGESQLGTLEFAGWTVDGRMAVRGSCIWEITDQANGRPFTYQEDAEDRLQPWWGIVGPVSGQSGWAYLMQEPGLHPADHPLLPSPAPVRTLTLEGVDREGAGTLLINGVRQTGQWLSAGVKGFDGPFTS